MFNAKRIKELESQLEASRQVNKEDKKKVAQLADAVYVTKELATLLNIYDNYKNKSTPWSYSYEELNLGLLAKDLRADNDNTERALRLAPLKKKR